MQIQLNGENVDIPDHSTIEALLEQAGFAGRRVAVEVNRAVVPRSRHTAHALEPGDRVEIVHALGGG